MATYFSEEQIDELMTAAEQEFPGITEEQRHIWVGVSWRYEGQSKAMVSKLLVVAHKLPFFVRHKEIHGEAAFVHLMQNVLATVRKKNGAA